MTAGSIRLRVGTRMIYDGEAVEVIETVATMAGNEVVLRDRLGGLFRVAVKELLFSDRVQLVPDGPGPSSGDDKELGGAVLAMFAIREHSKTMKKILERAEHVREVRTGYKSGSAELAGPAEPRPEYHPDLPQMARYEAKAAELGLSVRTICRWVAEAGEGGEASLAPPIRNNTVLDRCDPRWVEIATEVMVEHTDEATPMIKTVLEWTQARAVARYGADVVHIPGRSMAYKAMEELEKRHPTFRHTTKRNRDIADRPKGPYGKLRPTRPGEYVLMDTTRLDVFALDPVTLKWVNCELTVAMDWYTRCIVGLRLTPVSTKAVDAAMVLYQCYRPPGVLPHWPPNAVWPEHGIPRRVLMDRDAIEGPIAQAAGPALIPETIVVDHGKIYVSAHLTSVCARMGISIQPARLRTGRDKGPVERFFRTLRQDLLEKLPGYKGPNISQRGVDPEGQAFFYMDELADKIRQWIATDYHRRPHDGLVEPSLPRFRMSPAQMFEHGMARAGYVEVPRDPYLGLEFLQTKWVTVQHYGVEALTCRYTGDGLYKPDFVSPYQNGKWPIQVNPDDVTHAYFRDLDRKWHVLTWEHAAAWDMPLSLDALRFGRKLAAAAHEFSNDRMAVGVLLERWNLGLGMTRQERRMALRMSLDQPEIPLDLNLLDSHESLTPAMPELEGDDDAVDFEDTEVTAGLDEDAFYSGVLDDL